jgi:hypothetical protein
LIIPLGRALASARFQMLFLGLVIAVSLLPIWAFEYFPSQDGPIHLYNAGVLRHLLGPADSIIGRYYEINASPQPTWLIQVVFATLMLVTPALIAEKLLLTAYVVSLPLSIGYAVRPSGSSPLLALALAFPFVFNFPLYMGFYNFTISLPLLFFTLGYWIRVQGAVRLRSSLVLMSAVFLLYFAHPVSLVAFLVTAGIVALWFCAVQSPSGLGGEIAVGRRLKAAGKRVLYLGTIALPVLLLLSWYVMSGAEGEDRVVAAVGFNALELVQLASVNALRRGELTLSRLLALVLVALSGLVVARNLHRRVASPWDGFLVSAGVLTVMYLVPPAPSDVYIHDRLSLIIWLMVVIWLGGRSFRPSVVAAATIVSVALSVGFVAVRWSAHAALDSLIREYATVEEFVLPNSTLAGFSGSDGKETAQFEWRTDPFYHVDAYLALDKPVALLSNYQAWADYFPIRYEPARGPLGAHTLDTARVDLAVVWGRPQDLRHPDWTWPDVRALLDARFERVLSSPDGKLSAYRPEIAGH